MLGGVPHAQSAAKLLRDAARFFRTLSEKNSLLKGQMLQNEEVFVKLAELIEEARRAAANKLSPVDSMPCASGRVDVTGGGLTHPSLPASLETVFPLRPRMRAASAAHP